MLPARHLNRIVYTPFNIARRYAQSVSGSTTKEPALKNSDGDVYDLKSDMLQTIDIDDLPRAQKRFAKQFEKVNDERIKEIFQKNYKNQIGFVVLLSFVIGIYVYTIAAVQQETFLEEIDQEVAEERGEIQPTKK